MPTDGPVLDIVTCVAVRDIAKTTAIDAEKDAAGAEAAEQKDDISTDTVYIK